MRSSYVVAHPRLVTVVREDLYGADSVSQQHCSIFQCDQGADV